MSFSPARLFSSKRRAAIALASVVVAATTVGIAAPAIASALYTPTRTAPDFASSAHTQALGMTAKNAVIDGVSANAEVSASGLTLTTPVVDVASLNSDLSAIANPNALPTTVLAFKSAQITAETEHVVAETAALRADLSATQQLIAEQQAAEEAARVQAEAEAAAAAANTPEGAQATARSIAANDYGWGDDQFSCLKSLWNKESGWNFEAYNPSGAYGIPQSLPGDKMATIGDDWATNATTQIIWGLSYIDRAYGTPCGAWSHSQATDWY